MTQASKFPLESPAFSSRPEILSVWPLHSKKNFFFLKTGIVVSFYKFTNTMCKQDQNPLYRKERLPLPHLSPFFTTQGGAALRRGCRRFLRWEGSGEANGSKVFAGIMEPWKQCLGQRLLRWKASWGFIGTGSVSAQAEPPQRERESGPQTPWAWASGKGCHWLRTVRCLWPSGVLRPVLPHSVFYPREEALFLKVQAVVSHPPPPSPRPVCSARGGVRGDCLQGKLAFQSPAREGWALFLACFPLSKKQYFIDERPRSLSPCRGVGGEGESQLLKRFRSLQCRF